MEDIISPRQDPLVDYVNAKLGNWYLAHHFSTLPSVKSNNILSITQNPGNLKTKLIKNAGSFAYYTAYLLLYPPKMGAYTELWAGLSQELGMQDQGGYVIPWGRRHDAPRQDLLDSMKRKEDGGTNRAQEFVEWCEDQIKDYLR